MENAENACEIGASGSVFWSGVNAVRGLDVLERGRCKCADWGSKMMLSVAAGRVMIVLLMCVQVNEKVSWGKEALIARPIKRITNAAEKRERGFGGQYSGVEFRWSTKAE